MIADPQVAWREVTDQRPIPLLELQLHTTLDMSFRSRRLLIPSIIYFQLHFFFHCAPAHLSAQLEDIHSNWENDDRHSVYQHQLSVTRDRLYRLTSTLQLIGVDRNVSLAPDNFATLRLGYAYHKVHGDYQLAISRDGSVLGIDGQGIHLEPVDVNNYPNIFVNTMPNTNLSNNIDINSALKAVKSPCNKLLPLRIAVAFSHRLCRRFGSYASTVDAIRLAFTAASRPYEKQLCIKLKIVFMDGYCRQKGDPYRSYSWRFYGSRARQKKILSSFKALWDRRKKHIKRDVAIYIRAFSGKDRLVGSAYVGTACRKWSAFGWVDGLRVGVIAHEIGHSMNAYHDGSGVMKATIRAGAKMQFSGRSAQQIRAYSTSRSCPSQPTDQSTVSGKGQTTGRTCGEKFKNSGRQLGFACSRGQMARYKWTNKATMAVSFAISRDKFVVTTRLGSRSQRRFRYRQVLLLVSARNNIQSSSLTKFAKMRTITHDRLVNNQAFSASQLEAPQWSSCCRQLVSVYVKVVIEDRRKWVRWSGIIDRKLQWTIPCRSCVQGKTISSMRASRPCPVCN